MRKPGWNCINFLSECFLHKARFIYFILLLLLFFFSFLFLCDLTFQNGNDKGVYQFHL